MPDSLLLAQLRARKAAGLRIRPRRAKKWLFPVNAERRLEARVRAVLAAVVVQYREKLLPSLERLAQEAAHSRRDSWSDDVDALIESVRLGLDVDRLEARKRIAREASEEISGFNQNEWRRIVRAGIGVDIYLAEPWLRDELRTWSQETAALITTLEDDAVRQVAIWTNRGLREGWRWEDIAKQIEDRFEVSRARADFIARDQTAKLNGSLTHRRQTAAGVTHYYWRDSRDERVRGNPSGKYASAKPSHWARNGKRIAWADPPEGGHPGFDYNCRCTAEPDLRGLLAGL